MPYENIISQREMVMDVMVIHDTIFLGRKIKKTHPIFKLPIIMFAAIPRND